jgi:GntR family transcriptional regulator
MFFNIDSDSPVPIYEQIVSQVTFAVAAGILEPGGKLPSVRELAAQLTINPNTVAKAFQELERHGVVRARRGLGMEVTPAAPRLCRARRQEIVCQRIRDVLREAVSSGLPADEIQQLVEEELARARSHQRTRERQRWSL